MYSEGTDTALDMKLYYKRKQNGFKRFMSLRETFSI